MELENIIISDEIELMFLRWYEDIVESNNTSKLTKIKLKVNYFLVVIKVKSVIKRSAEHVVYCLDGLQEPPFCMGTQDAFFFIIKSHRTIYLYKHNTRIGRMN